MSRSRASGWSCGRPRPVAGSLTSFAGPLQPDRGVCCGLTWMSTGQLEVLPWHEAYLRGDRFEQDAMLALVEEMLRSNEAAGYPLTRIVAHMEWALEDRPGVDDLVEYETRLNFLLPRYKDPVI